MDYRYMGNTGVKVSQLCFGTMSFGGDADEEMSRALYQMCRTAGINFFDCANVYAHGRSEEILGELIHSERDQIVLTSKAYFPVSEDVNARGASRKHLVDAVAGSLRRLKTDYIDVFFIHRFDDMTGLEETLRGLEDLVRQGKILYPAVSNFAAWQVEKALGIQERLGWARLAVLQPMYNLVKRQAEVEILPMAQAENLAVIPYSPLGGGLLSGKYSAGQKPESGRLIANAMYQVRYAEEWMYTAAEKFTALAHDLGYHPASLAVAWVGSHPGVTAPIIGARNLGQLEDSLKSVDVAMTPELRGRISALTPTPPPATDRNEEQTDFNYGKR